MENILLIIAIIVVVVVVLMRRSKYGKIERPDVVYKEVYQSPGEGWYNSWYATPSVPHLYPSHRYDYYALPYTDRYHALRHFGRYW
jgi:hypothetical protein